MPEPVKRQYRSTLRNAQAHDTRRTLVTEAARLFVTRGYAATTIDAVAQAAAVSRKTVFTSVGGKVELLKLAVDWAVAGDDEPVALADRPSFRALLASTDPEALVRDWVSMNVDIDVRAAALVRVLEVAADADEAAAVLRAQLSGQRMAGARTIAHRVAELGALRGGLSVDAAADIAWLHIDPMLYVRLVVERGWDAERFAHWLRSGLVGQLLADQPKNAAASS